jgi:hypothetical protein
MKAEGIGKVCLDAEEQTCLQHLVDRNHIVAAGKHINTPSPSEWFHFFNRSIALACRGKSMPVGPFRLLEAISGFA